MHHFNSCDLEFDEIILVLELDEDIVTISQQIHVILLTDTQADKHDWKYYLLSLLWAVKTSTCENLHLWHLTLSG